MKMLRIRYVLIKLDLEQREPLQNVRIMSSGLI